MNRELRELFPVTRNSIYLNHAAVSPPPTPTIEAVKKQLADVNEHGSVNFRDWLAVKESARRLTAEMISARPEQIAFMRNTSDGLSTIANGLCWNTGDNLVTFRNEFPSNVYPWLRLRDAYGVEVRMCEEVDGRVDVDQLIGMIDSHTRIVAISHVQYASGFRADLERIGRAARAHDALFVVDLIQAMGVIPINVEAQLIDAAAGAGHKWLLTPEGVGILYLSDRARARVEPTLVGWISVPEPEDYENFEQGWKLGALAWETGTFSTSLMYGLEESLKLIHGLGVEAIARHLEHLTDFLCESLTGREYEIVSSRIPGEKSQIVCIRHLGGLSPMALFAQLKNNNIITAPRGDRLRISPHCYNTVEDMAIFIDSLP